MSIKEKFTPTEWEHLLQSPMLAGLAITAADPGGLWGAVREGGAMAGSLMTARKEAAADSLVATIVAEFETSEGRGIAADGVKELVRDKKPAEVAHAAVERLGEIAKLVTENVPEEADALKTWLRETAVKVAEAGTEGGFLGFGGVKVSEAEKKTLAEIEAALG
ncbi:MAG: hypothetical protein AAGD47_06955 [Pseudomonadota bacterium]